MEQLRVKIAGEIALAQDAGTTMKKWRDIFNVTQSELAEYLKISPSTISDYESNRRKSPGIAVIHRFVDALFAIDSQRGGEIAKRFKEAEGEPKQFFETVNFPKPLSVGELAKKIDAKMLYGKEKMDSTQLFGCTIIDAVKVILELPQESFVKVYGTTSQRALLFTGVATGRSTLVAVRMAPIKPACVILHGVQPEEVDKLAVKIAESEGLPLLSTNLPLEEIRKRLADNAAQSRTE